MWKKDEAQDLANQPPRTPAPNPAQAPRSEPMGRSTVASGGDRATIGRSITIRGDVTGDEDLVVQGRVEGTVDLKQHSVTVGPEGVVKADISGRMVTVEGEVKGNLKGQEQVTLRSSARVEGDIVSPRVVLEDGATFRGSIDMSPPGSKPSARPMPAAEPEKSVGPGPGAGGGESVGPSKP